MKNFRRLTVASMVIATVAAPLLCIYNPIQAKAAEDKEVRQLTVHKYLGLSEAILSGTRDDGVNTTVDTNKHKPLGGVEFSYSYVTKGAGEKTVTGTFKTGNDGSYTLVLGEGSDFDTTVTLTEKPNSGLTIDGKSVPKSSVAEPLKPFTVKVPMTDRTSRDKLVYHVHVNPKNDISYFDPIKTVGTDNGINHSSNTWEEFTWFYKFDIPSNLVSDSKYADYFGFVAKENENLQVSGKPIKTATSDEVKAKMVGIIDGATKLTAEDFTVLNTDGSIQVLLTKAGMDKAQGKKKIVFEFKTSVKEDFNGIISNDFNMIFKRPDANGIEVPNKPGVDPVVPEGNNPPTTPSTPNTEDSGEDAPKTPTPNFYSGGFKLLKTASNLKDDEATPDKNEAALAGAEFKIALSEEDAKAGKFVQKGGKDYVVTSDTNGIASFNGLALIVEGKESLSTISKDYWIVESKAPTGYELLKDPIKVTIKLDSASQKYIVTAVNDAQADLPWTGGSGRVLIFTAAIGVLSIGVLAYSKSKTKETE